MRLFATCGRIVSSTAVVGTMAALAMALAATTVPAQERGEEREAERADQRAGWHAGERAPSANPKRTAPIALAATTHRIAGVPYPRPNPRPRRGATAATSDLVRETIAASAFAPHQPDPVASLYEAANSVAEGTSPPASSALPPPAVASLAGPIGTLGATEATRASKRPAAPTILAALDLSPASGSAFDSAGRRSSSLRDALDALRADRYAEAIERRNGLSDPLDRRIVDYFLIRSGTPRLSAAMIAEYARGASGWPSANLVRAQAEAALARATLPPAATIAALGDAAATATGTHILAKAHVANGDRARAEELVRSAWRGMAMSDALQRRYAADFGELLDQEDHLRRVDMLVARDRFDAAKGLSGHLAAGARSYLDARIAAARAAANAAALLKAVPEEFRRRSGYRLAEVELARRGEAYERAARLIADAPATVDDGDAWWVESRIVARTLAERGQGRLAYDLVARRFAEGRSERADEAFHAGWLALTELGDGARAEAHFAELAEIATRSLTISRAAYWRARAAKARGASAAARTHFEAAAVHGHTYYGQLARVALGRSGTGLAREPEITNADRVAFAKNEVAEAVRRLIEANHAHRIAPLLNHLAQTVASAGEAALTVGLAEDAGNERLALMVAKEAQRRGLPIGRLAHPTGAIPRDAAMPAGLDRALVYAIARQESLFDPDAISPVGARGLMQIMPRTAAAMARELGLKHTQRRLTSDPAYNATLGAAYLTKRLADFDGSYILTFAAYNAGAGRVREWIGRFGDPRDPDVDPLDWVERIPYPETRNYVQRVLENVQVYREALGTGRLAIESDLNRGRRG